MKRLVRGKNCMPTVCVDTNIWIYALSVPSAGDLTKHQLAQNSIQTAGKITLTPQTIKHQQQIDGLRIINPFK